MSFIAIQHANSDSPALILISETRIFDEANLPSRRTGIERRSRYFAIKWMRHPALSAASDVAIPDPMPHDLGLHGLWGAVLVFMGVRGIAQAAWYPRLERRI